MSGQQTGPKPGSKLDGTRPKPYTFLPKANYKQRRLIDALKLWPVLGVIGFALPVMWTLGAQSNVFAMTFLFLLWAFLLVGTFWLNRAYGETQSSADVADERSDA